ncbi:hypothetical protein GCM10011367_02510 [Marinicauda pacifica]|uniref:DUF885 domain-containing protein n=1 Tax=Marinicauda pacifica TaxID=1133559 RepID=A0A4S2HEB2_9PROT|nr:DUF885 domain-containing protein [Marinicauda pacifica]TGY93942.1 DUF885 domain-containing protein [Marinicauda pacifica]GGE31627.1 hypothetical protein GCM10011367_02510 [Marinicauda pacifica]
MLKYLMGGVASVALLAAAPHAAMALTTTALQATEAETPAAGEQTETERLYAWMDEVFQTELQYSPESKTQLGIIDEDYDDWGPRGDEAAAAEHARRQEYRAELIENFDRDLLDEAGKLSYDFLIYQGTMSDRLYQVRESGYVFSPMGDAVSGLTTFMINAHQVRNEEHAEAYLSRLAGLGEIVDDLVEEAEERAENGVRLPLFAYPRLTASAERQMSGAPFDDTDTDSAILADFRGKVEALDLSEEDGAAMIARAEEILLDSYQPALQRYVASLEEMETHADERAGIWKNPNGAEYYEAQVAFFTTRDDLTAQDVHEIGLSEVERIQNEMRGIMEQVGFEGDLQEFFEFLRTDEQFYYPDTDEGQQAYLERSTEIIDQVMEVAPEYFDTLPEADLEVRAVEEWREATATGAFYNQPALDGSRPGYYYVNLSNMADNPNYLMESLAYHEGAPGHHFQIALAMELEDVPMLQKLAWYSAYGEGWALYAEHLGKDMGFFEDPYMDFGRLSYELFRAVRLVVDTGLHDQRWTREEAIAYMMENTPMTEGDITPEVERYIVWPGQALSYKIGMMTILDLREQAMERLGDDFDYGGFHDAVLTAGTIPLPLLRTRVESWIASVEAGE